MQEITKIERYEIRGNIVYDKSEKRPARLDEIKDALNFMAFTKGTIADLRARGLYEEPF